MNHLKIAFIIGTIAMVSGTSVAIGFGWRSILATQRKAECAASIVAGDLAKCPEEIKNGFAARSAFLAAQDVGVREDAMQSISDGAVERTIIYRERAASVAEFSNVERTSECAASPAMQLRRRQLQRDAEGDAPNQPEAAGPTG